MTAREIQKALAQPFAPEELEWRLQVVIDENRGIAVPYVTNRAIQNRLDNVMGVDCWSNEYRPWHSTGKKESQVCGISLYFEGRGWITKWDGAEDSKIESVKGGLSDAMKRAAVQWGIGRYLYGMDVVFVSVEKRGDSSIIRKDEYSRLDQVYRAYLQRLNLPCPASSPANTETDGKKESTALPFPVQPRLEPEYTVKQINRDGGCVSLTLLENRTGKAVYGFIPGEHPEIVPGVQLGGVEKEQKQRDSVVYYQLNRYTVINAENAA